ncbi:C39 family peptidase [Nocardioides pacificus]
MPRPRSFVIGASALVLSLALVPFLPDGDGDRDRGAITPAGRPSATPESGALVAGTGALTPAMRAEIDRVVSTGTTSARRSGKVAPEQLAADAVRCATFEGERYCLNTGWTTESEDAVQARVAASARTVASRSARGSAPESTGDLDALALAQRVARMAPAARARAERRELVEAARSVAKVVLLRHQVQGTPLPAGFLDRHPEVRPSTAGISARAAAPLATSARSGGASTKMARDYPSRATVLRPGRTAEQTTTYWCGPATMQMIAWGWGNNHRSQDYWARRLGTTRSGSAITEMVRVTNQATGWDRPDRAGRYVALSIADWSYADWIVLQMRHVVDYRSPVILHPVLLKRFYPYLDDDASGHFQVGRGYRKGGKAPIKLSYFEPWNQQRFDPSEPYIGRVQWRNAYRSYRANQAHFQQNIGV